jgi:hypothetical protein
VDRIDCLDREADAAMAAWIARRTAQWAGGMTRLDVRLDSRVVLTTRFGR